MCVYTNAIHHHYVHQLHLNHHERSYMIVFAVVSTSLLHRSSSLTTSSSYKFNGANILLWFDLSHLLPVLLIDRSGSIGSSIGGTSRIYISLFVRDWVILHWLDYSHEFWLTPFFIRLAFCRLPLSSWLLAVMIITSHHITSTSSWPKHILLSLFNEICVPFVHPVGRRIGSCTWFFQTEAHYHHCHVDWCTSVINSDSSYFNFSIVGYYYCY